MELSTAIAAVKQLQQRQKIWNYTAGVISHDMSTGAPSASAEAHGDALAQLAELQLREFTSPETGELLAFLQQHSHELDTQTAREVEVLAEDYDRQRRIPAQEWADFQRDIAISEAVWEDAKHQNDYALWEPHLRKLIDTSRRMAAYTQPDKHPYDAMLDDYEKGQTRETLDRFFSVLRSRLVPLVKAVAGTGIDVDDSFLYRSYPVAKQRELTAWLADVMGLDRAVCAVGESEHPFTADFCRKDTRITTHYH